MSFQKKDIVQHRIDKSFMTYQESLYLCRSGFYSGAVNRLYYSCFQMVSALLLKDNIITSTQNSIKNEFIKNYIKTGILDKKFSTTYTVLMDKGQETEYGDFLDYKEDEVLSLLNEVDVFIHELKNHIDNKM